MPRTFDRPETNFTGEITDPADPSLHILLQHGIEVKRYYLKKYETGGGRLMIKQKGKHPVHGDMVMTEDMTPMDDGDYHLMHNDAGVNKISVTDGKIDDVSYNDEIETKAILLFVLVLIVLGVLIAGISHK